MLQKLEIMIRNITHHYNPYGDCTLARVEWYSTAAQHVEYDTKLHD